MPPQNNRHWIYLLAGIILIIILYITGQGCNSINRATQQVLASTPAFNRVGATWAKLNPCVTDSIKTLVHDTTVKTDTAWRFLPGTPRAQATPGKQTDTGDALKPAFRPAHTGTEDGWGYITKTITLHDSVKIVAVDKRQLGICNDSLVYYKMLFASFKEQSLQQTSGWKHKARTRLWIIIAMLMALAAYILRKPLLQLATGGLAQWLPKKL
jgi:hypothetical protein